MSQISIYIEKKKNNYIIGVTVMYIIKTLQVCKVTYIYLYVSIETNR